MVNKIGINDIDKFYELGLLVNSNFENLFNLKELLNNKYDYIFGYYDNNILVGFIHVNKLYENMDIINIVVDKDYRRRGIGNKLINYVVNEFSDVDSIMLEVNVNNTEAINLYNVNKFKVIHKRLNYYGEDDALIMKRDVKNERC